MDSSIGLRDGQGRAGAGRHGADLQLRPGARHHPRIAKRLPVEPPVLELDVTDEDHLAGLEAQVREHVDGLDGVVHSIAYGNPETLLGGKFLTGPWPDVAQAVQVSAYSLKALAEGFPTADGPRGSVDRRPHLRRDGRVARRTTGWEWRRPLSSPRRATARVVDIGVTVCLRSNLVSAGPLKDAGPRRRTRASRTSSPCGSDRPLGEGQHRQRADGAGPCVALLRLLPRHDRRDHPRGRRSARDGCLRWPAAGRDAARQGEKGERGRPHRLRATRLADAAAGMPWRRVLGGPGEGFERAHALVSAARCAPPSLGGPSAAGAGGRGRLDDHGPGIRRRPGDRPRPGAAGA